MKGQQVPAYCFKLPMKTAANTAERRQTANGQHFRPAAATGATIDLTAGAGCGSQGALYSVGCSMGWQGTDLTAWSTTTVYQDWVLAPNSTTATLVNAAYTYNTAPAETTTLSVQGTYTFFVYDSLNQVIVAAVYVNAGASFNIGVYQDPYHTQLSYQYNINTSNAAYIYLPNVSTNDKYVVYVEYTSINTFCVFLTPNGVPAPGSPSPFPTGAVNSLICNPSTSAGAAAPNGTLSLTWNFGENYPAGTYSVIVYDQTANQTLGQVQVSLTGFQQYGFVLNGSPAPNPSPAAPATPTAIKFAWDSVNEQSTGGIQAAVPNQVGGTYTMTASDPDGQVVFNSSGITIPGTCTLVNNSSSTCTATGLFKFASASPALNPSGTYPNSIFTMQLYDPANKIVEASQAFQLLGYSLQTEFTVAGVTTQSLSWVPPQNPIAASMKFINTANINYPNSADPIAGIEYTTGSPSTALTTAPTAPLGTAAGGGNGVTVTVSGCAGSYLTGCSTTVTDTSGNSWTLTDYCSTNANVTNPGLNDQCDLILKPQNNARLAPGASITVPGLSFYAYAQGNNAAWPCYNTPCESYTSILPADGLSWSSTNAASPAWTPVYFTDINNALQIVEQAFFIGSTTLPGNTPRNTNAVSTIGTAPVVPWIGAHFYPANFAQGSYQESTPFDSGSNRRDILVIDLEGCTGAGAPTAACTTKLNYNAGEVGITFPSSINAASITVDPSEPATPLGQYYARSSTGGNSCYATLPPNSICLNPNAGSTTGTGNNQGTGIEQGSVTQIWLDVPPGTASFLSQELEFQVWDSADFGYATVIPYPSIETPVAGGGNAGVPVDGASIQSYSLNSNLMAAQFDPSTVSAGATTTSYSVTFTNTTTAGDPNPDPVDAIVLEQVTSNGWTVSGVPTFSGTGSAGWSNLSGTGYNVAGNDEEYWFGVCANQYTNHTTAGPPQAPPNPTNPSAAQTALGAGCTAAQEQDAIAPGGSLTMNFTLNDTAAGTQTFYLYAHGANGGGWSAPKTLTVTSSAKSAKVQIFSAAADAAGTDASCSTTQTVAQNTAAQVSGPPNCFIYEVTNTSSAGQNIGTVDISLPAFDINGVATSSGAWDLNGAPITQYVVLGTISGGTFKTTGIPAGCAISAPNTFNPVAGSTAGQIQVSGCTGLSPGTNIAVEFVAQSPTIESDSYLLPATIDGATAGLAWTGSDEVTVAFSLGLSVTVDPDNPGPGNSHPVVVCNPAQCTFSGETVNFGEFPANTTITGQDVVRATVVYTGSTGTGVCPAGAGAAAQTWQLQVSVNNGTTEFTTDVDEANSTSGLTYSAAAGAYFSPTATNTTLACGKEQANTDYDVLQNYEVQNGADTSGHNVTVIYTLIGN